MRLLLLVLGVLLGAAAGAAPATAHSLGASGAGLAQGFVHPFGGLDHLLAMVAVGVWAAQLGGRALWMVPGSFVAVMAVGFLLGNAGLAVSGLETAIAGSVAVLGLLVTLAVRPPAILGAFVVAVFAVFHGQAHALEIAGAVSPAGYAAGFTAASVMLHGVGILAALAAGRGPAFGASMRAAGMLIAGSGVAMLVTG